MRTVICGFAQDNLEGAFGNPPQAGNTIPFAMDFNGSLFVTPVLTGTGFNRSAFRGLTNDADNIAVVTDPENLATNGYGYIFDGTTWDRQRSASANNLSPTSDAPPGMALSTSPGQWAFFHQPAVSTRATVTRGAGGATIRNVCTGFGFTLNAVGAITVPVVVNLRDGATGAGTVLWTGRYTAPVGTTIAIDVSGLNIVGSPNTAMTFEFAAAPAAGDFQSVNIQGYRIG